MPRKLRPLRTTIVGGLTFLIPFGVLLLVFAKIFEIMALVAAPIGAWLPLDRIGGVAIVNIIAIGLILLVCYVAGYLATGSRARSAYRRLDDKLLTVFPRYAFIKAMAEGLDQATVERTLKPVLARFDDVSQLAFEVERDAGHVVLYLPGSPDPWSGSVAIMTVDRVQPLESEFTTVVKSLRTVGRGTLAITRSAEQKEGVRR